MDLRERLLKALSMEGRIEAIGIVSEILARGEALAGEWMGLESNERIGLVGLVARCPNLMAREALRLLYSKEEDFRVLATLVKALGQYRDPSLVPLFMDALDSQEPRVRANAIDALDWCDEASVRDKIRPMLHDQDNRVRANAVRALWSPEDREVLDQAMAMLQDPDLWVRTSAAYIIRHIPDRVFVEPLIKLLEDPFDSVREKAVVALGIIGDPGARDALLIQLEKSLPPYIQSEILQALASIGGAQVARKLEGFLRDQKEGLLIRQAIAALGRCGDRETLDLLMGIAGDSGADEWIRWEALNAVENLAFPTSLQALVDMAADPREKTGVREKAARVLKRFAGPAELSLILEKLTDENMRLFEPVLDSLEGDSSR